MLKTITSGILILVLLTSCALDPVSKTPIFSTQSIEEDEWRGKEVCTKMVSSLGPWVDVNDSRMQRVQTVFNKLIPHTQLYGRIGYHGKMWLVDSNTPEAFTCGGGYVVITTGLFNVLPFEDDIIAAVIAHELAHTNHRHAAQNKADQDLVPIIDTVGAIITAALGGDVQAHINSVNLRKTIVEPFTIPLYSRQQETEADKTSIEYMCKAGFNPYAAVNTHKIYLKNSNKSVFRTHPTSEDRVSILQDTIKTVCDKKLVEAYEDKRL